MSLQNKSQDRDAGTPGESPMQRWLPLGLILALAAGAAVLLLRPGSKPADAPKIESPQPPPAPTSPVEAKAKSDFEKLKGRWSRTDGDYVVEVRSIDSDGKMDAGYFNPQPIKVAKAEASQDGATTKVFIELRDVNYPGSTYTLAYDRDADMLKGIYFQAASGQQYEVYFERVKP